MSRLEIRADEMFPPGLLAPPRPGERDCIARRLAAAALARRRRAALAALPAPAPAPPPAPPPVRWKRRRRAATPPAREWRFEPPMPATSYEPPLPFPGAAEARVYPTIARILARTSARYGVAVIDLLSARRTLAMVRARHIGMYLAKTLTLRSLPEIGRRFGDRDHTTVLHAVRKIEARLAADRAFAAEIAALTTEIVGASENESFPQWGFV